MKNISTMTVIDIKNNSMDVLREINNLTSIYHAMIPNIKPEYGIF